MKIQLMSDLHSEFYKNEDFNKFVNTFDPTDVDVLVLAGDVGNSKTYPEALRALIRKYEKADVLFVHGNHDRWLSSFDESNSTAEALEKEFTNFHFLNNSLIEIKGQRFLGGSMFFEESEETRYVGKDWVDFHYIKNGEKSIYQDNRNFIAFLQKELKKDDIVITHHLPSYDCVNEIYKGDPSNCFFVCEMDELIAERGPKLWMNGHTHSSYDLMIGKTRCICNPHGYHDYNVNKDFNHKLVLDI